MSASDPRRIYLDHNATTPLRPEVREAMLASFGSAWGNPSSIHADGRQAREAVERARAEVASLLGALREEIVFTSGGTEANNLAIRGLARAGRDRRRALWGAASSSSSSSSPAASAPAAAAAPVASPHVISSPLEHPSVVAALAELEREGFVVTRLPVDGRGRIAVDDLRAALRDETVLVTTQMANHEIGNVNDVRALAAVARSRGAVFHTDAVQAAGRVPVDVAHLGVDAATVSAHKIYGPKGAGALFVRRGVELDALVVGGHQERERRGGTENVTGLVGFGAAARLAAVDLSSGGASVAALRDRLERQLLALEGARLHGDESGRVPGTTNVGFAGAHGQLVLIGLDLDGISVSTGAACSSGTLEPSPVLLALGLPAERAREAVRFSLGCGTTEADVDRAAAATAAVVARVRSAASAFALPAAG